MSAESSPNSEPKKKRRGLAETTVEVAPAKPEPPEKAKAEEPEHHPDPAEQTYRWILDGNSETDIGEALAKFYPGAEQKCVLDAVMNRFRDAADFEADVIMGWCIEACRDLYRRMVEIGDFAGALRAVKQMADFSKYTPSGIRHGVAE